MGAGARALGAKGPEMWKEGGEPLSGNTGQRGAGLASFTPSLVLSPLAPCLAPTTQPTPHTPKRGFQSPAGTTPILPWTTPTLPFISFPQKSLGRAPPGQGPPRGLPTAAQFPGLHCYHSCPRASRGTAGMPLPQSVPAQRMASSWCCPTAPGSLPRKAAASDRLSTWTPPAPSLAHPRTCAWCCPPHPSQG